MIHANAHPVGSMSHDAVNTSPHTHCKPFETRAATLSLNLFYSRYLLYTGIEFTCNYIPKIKRQGFQFYNFELISYGYFVRRVLDGLPRGTRTRACLYRVCGPPAAARGRAGGRGKDLRVLDAPALRTTAGTAVGGTRRGNCPATKLRVLAAPRAARSASHDANSFGDMVHRCQRSDRSHRE